jgi:serine/threonine protein kinase
VHRDIKDRNVIIWVENKQVKIIDFGLIKTGLNYGTYRFGGLAEEDEVVAQIKPFFTLIDDLLSIKYYPIIFLINPKSSLSNPLII